MSDLKKEAREKLESKEFSYSNKDLGYGTRHGVNITHAKYIINRYIDKAYKAGEEAERERIKEAIPCYVKCNHCGIEHSIPEITKFLTPKMMNEELKQEARERIATQLSFIEDAENIKLIAKAIYSIVDIVIDKAPLAEQKRLNGLAELATLAQKKRDAEIAKQFKNGDIISKAILNQDDDE